MKTMNAVHIIGVDHGCGNIKTANHCFKTGILGYDSEPLFTGDMLTYNGRYYLIGEGHKEFIAEKIKDEDYYLLTLVAIAKELKDAELTEANIVLAAGLPLTWTSGQKKEFAAYLGKNKEVDFNYKKVDYHITIDDVRIYPQGYAAIAEFASTMKGVNVVADIGNGTMNVLYMVNGRPQSGKMYTEKFGTYQCTLAIREMFMQKTQREINDAIIEEVLCDRHIDTAEEFFAFREDVDTQIAQLERERELIRNKLRRAPEEGKEALKLQAKAVTKKITPLQTQQKIVKRIAKRTPQMQNLLALERMQETQFARARNERSYTR